MGLSIDREKVIKGLEIHIKPNSRCVGCPYPNNGLCGDQLYHDALALLKEQEAVEARKKNDGKPQPWTSWWYVCGDCGQEIEYHDRFCRWCGRPVKWE